MLILWIHSLFVKLEGKSNRLQTACIHIFALMWQYQIFRLCFLFIPATPNYFYLIWYNLTLFIFQECSPFLPLFLQSRCLVPIGLMANWRSSKNKGPPGKERFNWISLTGRSRIFPQEQKALIWDAQRWQ